MAYLRGFLGILILISIAYFLSSHRKKIDWKLVGAGIFLQILIALLVLKLPLVRNGFDAIGSGFVKFLSFASFGAQFLFGDLAKNSDAVENSRHSLGFLFAFQALPTVIFFSSVTAGLY